MSAVVNKQNYQLSCYVKDSISELGIRKQGKHLQDVPGWRDATYMAILGLPWA